MNTTLFSLCLTLSGHRRLAWCPAAAPGARSSYLVSGGADGVVKCWDAATGSLVTQWAHHTAAVERLLVLGEVLLTVSADCCVGLVALDTMQVERLFPAHPSTVQQVSQ